MAREDGFTISDIKRQVKEKINIIAAIESFIMTHWNDIQGEEDINEAVTRLSEGTLAYHLSNDEEKQQIVQLFKIISENIDSNVVSTELKQSFGKTLFGLEKTMKIFEWVQESIDSLSACQNLNDLFEVLWP